jgi:hypothetical protein
MSSELPYILARLKFCVWYPSEIVKASRTFHTPSTTVRIPTRAKTTNTGGDLIPLDYLRGKLYPVPLFHSPYYDYDS